MVCLVVVPGMFVEAQLVHVPLYGVAVVVLEAVAFARLQLGGLLLPPQDADGVVAAHRALLSVEHGLAVAVVVVQGRRTEGVGAAYPLGDAAGYHRSVHGLHDGRATHL